MSTQKANSNNQHLVLVMSRYLSTQEYVTHIGKGIKNVVLTFAILLAKTKNMSTSMQWCDTNIGIESENTLQATKISKYSISSFLPLRLYTNLIGQNFV